MFFVIFSSEAINGTKVQYVDYSEQYLLFPDFDFVESQLMIRDRTMPPKT